MNPISLVVWALSSSPDLVALFVTALAVVVAYIVFGTDPLS